MLALIAAAAVAAQAVSGAPAAARSQLRAPGRDPALLHREVAPVLDAKDREQELSLRGLLALGGPEEQQAEILARLAGLLRGRGLTLTIRAQAEADNGDADAANRDRRTAVDARTEAIARYRELLQRFPHSTRQDEALFFLADTLQDSNKDAEAVLVARELVRRYPKSVWAPASHVFIGEHLFDAKKLDEALAEYRAAAAVPTDEVYPYALYKAAWCRYNQSAFSDALDLLHKVVTVSQGGDSTRPLATADATRVQLAREARRDYVLVYSRVGKPESAQQEFSKAFGPENGLHMLELYTKLLFDGGRDPEAVMLSRQLLTLHGDSPAAALDETRLLVIASRTGKRRDLLREARSLRQILPRVSGHPGATTAEKEALDEARRVAEETLRTLAVTMHNEARKTNLDETFAAARALYEDYLALFPETPESYDMRYFAGELLYGLGQKAEAAALYEQVTRLDAAALKAHKKPGKWLTKAAWTAVLSRDEVVREQTPSTAGGAGQAAQAGTKGAASAAVAGAPVAQRPLTPSEKQLSAACLLYLDALPEGPHAVEVAFKVGRLEYLGGSFEAAETHLSGIALRHPEHELAEYAANLVLDIANLRKDWKALHGWAERFLGDRKLVAHGTLAQDLRRIEEQSAYALADSATPDQARVDALLAFVKSHPQGSLVERALLAASAALSRQGRLDDALATRARLWNERAASPLLPRALLASSADSAAVGDLGEAAALLERYAAGYRKQEGLKKWRREHPRPAGSAPPAPGPVYEEAKAQAGLHDAAVLREAREEFRQALQDRSLSLDLWPDAADRLETAQSAALLRAKLGEVSRAARELASLAAESRAKPSLQIACWRESARLFDQVHETTQAQRAWGEVERSYKALGPQRKEKLAPEAHTAAAEAHLALGAQAFEDFRKQRIEAPLLRTLQRKIALMQRVKKRAEETVALRQAEPAVCALAQLGEAQVLLAQSIVKSPVPGGLSGEQRQLYRAALQEKAQPLLVEARDTLAGAEARSRELGVSGACAAKTEDLLAQVGGGRPSVRGPLELGAPAFSPRPAWRTAAGDVLAPVQGSPAATVPGAPGATAPGGDPDGSTDEEEDVPVQKQAAAGAAPTPAIPARTTDIAPATAQVDERPLPRPTGAGAKEGTPHAP